MAANTDPIFSRSGMIGFSGFMTAANTTPDLTTGTSYLIFTADATNGSFVSKIRLRSTPAGNTTATVLRIWLNNGGSTATATNNSLFDEITLPVTTASAVAATPSYEIPINFALPAAWTIYGTLGTASANGWNATAICGKY